MTTSTHNAPSIRQILNTVRNIQANWTAEERAQRRIAGEARRQELAELVGLLDLEEELELEELELQAA